MIEPSTIIEICTKPQNNVFKGDILVVYGPLQNQAQNSCIKTTITITTTIYDNLITCFDNYFLAGKNSRINGFELKKKGQCECGDLMFFVRQFFQTQF